MTPTPPSGAGGLAERERLAGVLRSLAAWLIGETQGDHATLNRGDAADDCLTAAGILAALRSQGWVSVKERLPEPAKPALLWDGKRQWCGRIDAELAAQYHVTHYMPLPSPPATTKD